MSFIKSQPKPLLLLFWVVLNLLVVAFMDLALFTQTLPSIVHTNILNKILITEFFASIEWLFVIPSQRIGYLFFNPAQLGMTSYFFNFIGQIVSNNFWLKIPTLIDDYAGMVIILIGMYITLYRTFG